MSVATALHPPPRTPAARVSIRRGASLLAWALGAFLACGTAPLAAQPACLALPPRQPMPREARPERLEEPYWRARVADLSRVAGRGMSHAPMVFLGDSLIQGWDLPVWEQHYGRHGAANFGVSGDFVQGLLWRLGEGGQWPATLRPRLAVILIGTNNASYRSPPQDTALGIAEVARLVRRQSPGTRVLLLGLLPRGADRTDPARRLNEAVNELIARCADGQSVFFADPGRVLLDRQGHLADQLAPDRLHLSAEGYSRLSLAMDADIRALMAR